MTNDTPAPREPERETDETDESVADDPAYEPAYDPAKQAPVAEEDEGAVHDMVDVEHQEEAVYDLEDEAD